MGDFFGYIGLIAIVLAVGSWICDSKPDNFGSRP